MVVVSRIGLNERKKNKQTGGFMADLSDVQVGDILDWVSPDNHTPWDATVDEIKEDIIICKVSLDIVRLIQFDRHTGVHIWGMGYGYLEVKK